MSEATAMYARQVAAALAAVEVDSPNAYRWMGETFHLPEVVVDHADPEALGGALVEGLMWRLHGDFFVAGRPVCARGRAPASARRALTHELSAANSGTGSFDAGWRLVGRDRGRMVVERSGLRLWVRDGDWVATGRVEPAQGDPVAVRLPSELPEFSPGFYMALGDCGFSDEIPRRLDRFYLNIREEGAVEFIRHSTLRLNGEGLAFRAKVVDEPGAAFDRCDSAVLAFERRDRDRALRAVLKLHAALSEYLEPEIPALTRPLASGLAFAEDPGGGQSFGAHRSRLIAEAIIAAHERSVPSADGRLAVVGERFTQAGTSLEHPYLGGDSPGDLTDAVSRTFKMEERAACRR